MDLGNPRKRPRRASSDSLEAAARSSRQDRRRVQSPDRDLCSQSPGECQTYREIHSQDNAQVHIGNHITNTTHNNYGPIPTLSHLSSSSDYQLSKRQRFLELLYFEEMNNRYCSIRKNHEETCRWLLHTQEYSNWRDRDKIHDHQGFLWIKGKPGTGKSTIMRFALANAQKNLRTNMVISYFFHARGVELEKSVQGMYQALLYQMFQNLPDSAPVFETLRLHGHRLQSLKQEVLKDVFTLLVENLGAQPLTCFIDALDECKEDDMRDMVAFFEDLTRSAASVGVQFYVCFSSRHFPHITIKSQSFVLEHLEEHHADIFHYIESKLKIGQSKLAERIKADIKRRASGVFLWVYLVVRMLNEAYDRGHTHSLQDRLNDIPDGLDSLFRTIIESDTRESDTNDTDKLNITLQWILHARRPLKCEELYFAIRSAEQSNTVITWDDNELTWKDMRRFIVTSSKGLAEITKKKTVQFIHESVRTYLVGEKGLSHLQPRLAPNLEGLSHDDLKRCCQNYVSCYMATVPEYFHSISSTRRRHVPWPSTELRKKSEALHKDVSDKPFLQYANHGLLYHANAAHTHGVSQRDFVTQLPLKDWIALENLFEKSKSQRYTCEATLAYISAEQGFTGLLAIAVVLSGDFKVEINEDFLTALAVAVCRGDQHAVKILLNAGADPMSKATAKTTVLQLAANKGHAGIVRLLTEYGAELSIDQRRHGRLLYSAARKGYHDVVKTLLELNVTPNGVGRDYGTALQAASAKGHRSIVELLLAGNADVDCGDGYFGTALIAAVYNGSTDIAKLLLGNNASLSISKDTNGTALHAASAAGHDGLVRLLLQRGADINAQHPELGTPLQVASGAAYQNIVDLLLSEGADVNSLCGRFGTALQAASYRGSRDIAELLMNHGADVNAVAGTYGTALRAAAFKGHIHVTEMLLSHGAKVDLPQREPRVRFRSSYYRIYAKWIDHHCADFSGPDFVEPGRYSTALVAASFAGQGKIIDLLLNSGVNVNDNSGHGGTVLEKVIDEAPEDIIGLLLKRGATAKANMLYKAASRGFDKAVYSILCQRARIGIQREHLEQALRVATEKGHENVVDLLRDCSERWEVDHAVVLSD